MNPLTLIQSAFAAFVLGALVSGVAVYGWAHAKGAASHLEAVGALKTSVDSCNVAAGEAKTAADAAKAASTDLNARIDGVISGENAKLEKQLRGSRDKKLAYVPQGVTECERTVNAVRDQLMGGKR